MTAPVPAAAVASEGDRPAADRGLGHRAGLDGLRGVAVIAVLFFHGEFPWASGGFLGVSTFFTLSGFLITTLALDERGRSGRLDLLGFWRRRLRRLLPASLLGIGLAVVVVLAVGDHAQRTNLAGDVGGALGYVANWRFLLSEQSYADLFAAPSPLLHFWSLAIEEQFYLLFPLLLSAIWWARSRRRAPGRSADVEALDRRALGLVIAVLAAASLALSLVADVGQQRIYLGTDTRAVEILLGSLLAVVVHRAVATGWLDRRGPAQRIVAGAGLLSAVAAVAAWGLVSRDAAWLYRGGFAAYAAASALTVLAAALSSGLLARVLGIPVLVRLGALSYAVYLYHWPIFIWLRQGTDLGQWPSFLLGSATTLLLAELSFRFVEQPVRRRGRLLGRPAWRLAPPALLALVVGAVVVGVSAPRPTIDLEAAREALEQAPVEPPPVEPPPTAPTDEAPVAPPPARVAFFGDSTAVMTGLGFKQWLQAEGLGDVVPGGPQNGCSLIGGDELRLGSTRSDLVSTCADWPDTWATAVLAHQPTDVVVQIGNWDVQDRRLPGDPTWRGPGDDVFDAAYTEAMLRAVDVLSQTGATVHWILTPVPTPGEGRAGRLPDPAYEAVAPRIAVLNDLPRQLPALRPGQVRVIDLAAWLDATGEEAQLRPDGMHFSEATAVAVADRFLGPAVLDHRDGR